MAEIKLQVFRLDRHIDLSIGAYGEDAEDRPDMVAVALRRGGVDAGEAVIFGDTTAVIEAGRANGVVVVGVGTGRTSAEQLAEAGADCVLPDLTDTGAVVKLVRDLVPVVRCA